VAHSQISPKMFYVKPRTKWPPAHYIHVFKYISLA